MGIPPRVLGFLVFAHDYRIPKVSCHQFHKRPSHRGFTLVEIIAVLVLLGILAFGILSFASDTRTGLSAETNRVKSHLRYAQIRAQADIYEWRLVFTDTQTYQIGPVVSPGGGFTPQIIPGTNETQRTLENGVTVSANTTIRFDSWGRPLTDGGMPIGASQTMVLSDGVRAQDILITAQTGLIP